MNSIIVVAVVTSMFFLSVLLNKRNSTENPDNFDPNQDDSSLEEDFKDILAFIPLPEIQKLINNYFKYDKQLNDTRSFINDQKKFIFQALIEIPETWMFLKILQNLGLQNDHWGAKIKDFWTNLPKFEEERPPVASGGVTVMINKVLKRIPREELHIFLRDKKYYSMSFRMFLQTLRSPIFTDLCEKIEENAVLARHYYWAKQEEIEVILVVELLKKFYVYLTEEL
uniref:PiggyBac transposable element-derived protein domain-containing protein n=1 Tax=Bracon brevicornis TaxID=1563983 RepID=A0A6V7I324_9HYME